MASQWAAEHYAQAPLDAATAQQFAAVLQQRMYGQDPASSSSTATGTSSTTYQKLAADGHFENAESAQFASHDGAALMVGADGSTFQRHISQSEDSNILPQTYWSSPPSAAAAVTTE
jgi:hypothetical protein